MARVLVVDDQAEVRLTLSLLLRKGEHSVDEASSGTEAMVRIGSDDYDVVITDVRMEGMDGMELLAELRRQAPATQVIVMTAFGSIENAVEAMRKGAIDYVTKPITNPEEINIRVERAMAVRRLHSEVSFLKTEFRERYGISQIIGRSRALRECLERAESVASTDATVLIQGESGTGKELIAKAIHAASKRADRAFVPVNCAAIPEQVMESELFGHVKGAFTGAMRSRKGLFEEADGGTFFFDEITEISMATQAKLLRTLQEGEVRRVGDNKSISVNVRIIAATNRAIEDAVEEGIFREDLYYRLNVVPIYVPPLRDRAEDIPLLATHFIERYNREMGRHVDLTPPRMKELVSHDFPGNVRELQNRIQQLVALDGKAVHPRSPRARASSRRMSGTLQETVAEAERQRILDALDECGNDMQRVAAQLGLSGTTLWRKMKKYQLHQA